jgi:hypothetical protein
VNKLAVIFGLAFGLFLASCRLGAAHRRPHLTGTCEGACDHYLACKRAGDTAAHEACVVECRDVLQDEESLRAFESLSCKDTIEYVEGDSGRGPGQMVGAEHGD